MSSQTASTAPPHRGWQRWPAFLDGATDGAVVAFALWTVVYQVALVGQLDLRLAGWPVVAASAVLVVALGLREASRTPAPPPDAGQAPAAVPTPPAGSGLGLRLRVGVAVGAAVLGVAVAARETLGVLPVVLLAMVLVVAVSMPVRLRREAPGWEVQARIRPAEHATALLASLGLGVVSLFLLKPDADDVFYVNRSAWVAQHGIPSLRDTMFGPETYAQSFGGGLPTPSVEALHGVAAALFGVEAGTVAYLVWTPVVSVVFGWATWRLVRAWAPRRAGLVLVVALLFVLASGASIVGSYSLGRMWQGKVTAYAVLLPLVWVHLSALAATARRGGRDRLLVLLACGIAFVGLTTSSALLAPVVAGGGLLAALALRSRPLALGVAAFVCGPLVNGLVQVLGPAEIGTQSQDLFTSEQVFSIAFGSGTAMVVLGVVATALGPGVARSPVRVVAAAASLVTLVALLPGVLALADSLTGAGPVVWRLAIIAPTGVLVGLLAALPSASPGGDAGRVRRGAQRALAAGAVAVVIAVPLLGGRWLWSDQAGAELTSSPTWKVPQEALTDVRAARQLEVTPGLWLLPPAQMEVLAISTAGPFAVVPRAFYLPSMTSPDQQTGDRRLLLRLSSGSDPGKGGVRAVRAALERLDVSLACVPGEVPEARRILRAAVGGTLRPVGTMACHLRP